MKKESGEEAMTAAYSAVSDFEREAKLLLRDRFYEYYETRVAQAASYANDIREKEEEVLRKRQVLDELREECESIDRLIHTARGHIEEMKDRKELNEYRKLLARKAKLDELKETVAEQMGSIPTMLSALRFKYESEMRRIAVRSLSEDVTFKLGEKLTKKIGDTIRAEISEAASYMKEQMSMDLDMENEEDLQEAPFIVGETGCGICSIEFMSSGSFQRKVLGCAHGFMCVSCWEKYSTQHLNSYDEIQGIIRCPQCRAAMNRYGESFTP